MIAKLTFLQAPRFAPDHAVAKPSWVVESGDDDGEWNVRTRTSRRLEGAFCVATLALLLSWGAALVAAIA